MLRTVPTRAFLLSVLAVSPAGADVPTRPVPVIACPSLANLRILDKRSQDDDRAAAAMLADAKADHLGCLVLERERVLSVADQAAFDGRGYECLAIEGTSICHWTKAGAAAPVAPPRAAKPTVPTEKPRR